MSHGSPSVAASREPRDLLGWLDAIETRLAQRPRPAAAAWNGPDEAADLGTPTREELERMAAVDRCLDALQGLLLSPARVAVLRERIDAAIDRALERHSRVR